MRRLGVVVEVRGAPRLPGVHRLGGFIIAASLVTVFLPFVPVGVTAGAFVVGLFVRSAGK